MPSASTEPDGPLGDLLRVLELLAEQVETLLPCAARQHHVEQRLQGMRHVVDAGPVDGRPAAQHVAAENGDVVTTKPLDLSSNEFARQPLDFEPSVSGIGRTGQQ